jgi:pimeloyl-ACP methyl ester carboxylesterase
MHDSMIPVAGGRLHLVEQGSVEDPLILLVHAGIADLRSWDDLAPLLAAGGYRVARHDMRGFGATETDDVEFSNRADILAVLDHLGARQAALVGNSVGGQVAIDTAIEATDRIVAVVGVAAGLGGFASEATEQEEARFAEMDELAGADPPDPVAIAEFDVRFWVDGPTSPVDRVSDRIREAIRAMDEAANQPGRVGGRPIRLQPPAAERLTDLRCPVLAVAGELDASAVAQTARHLAANSPDARAVVWPDVAHMIGMEQPERLAAAILDFLEPLPRWS